MNVVEYTRAQRVIDNMQPQLLHLQARWRTLELARASCEDDATIRFHAEILLKNLRTITHDIECIVDGFTP